MTHEAEWAELVELAALDLLKVPSNRHRIAVLEVQDEIAHELERRAFGE